MKKIYIIDVNKRYTANRKQYLYMMIDDDIR